MKESILHASGNEFLKFVVNKILNILFYIFLLSFISPWTFMQTEDMKILATTTIPLIFYVVCDIPMNARKSTLDSSHLSHRLLLLLPNATLCRVCQPMKNTTKNRIFQFYEIPVRFVASVDDSWK